MGGFSTETRQRIAQEFEMAFTARRQGNEGRARVCARRAAGGAAKEYLLQQGMGTPALNAWDALNLLVKQPLSQEIQRSVQILTMRVNEEFSLPVEADVIREAQFLCEALEKLLVSKGDNENGR